MLSAFNISHIIFIVIVIFYVLSLGKLKVVTQVGVFFDLYILIVAFFSLIKILSKANAKLIYLTLFWVAFFVLYSIRFVFFMDFSTGGDLYEFSRSIRFCLYIICFSIILNYYYTHDTSYISKKSFISFIYFLLIVFFLSYLLRFVFFGDGRPWLFAENNFEIPIIVTFYCFLVTLKSNKTPQYLSVFLSFFSMSKSGMLEIFTAYFRLNKIKNMQQMLILGFAFLLILLLTAYLFYTRIESSGGKVDRFLFFNVFLNELDKFTVFEFLFGKGIAAELSFSSCQQLLFWVNSIFGKEASYCNATVYHSFFLRSFFEFGFLGLGAIMFTWYYLLSKAYGGSLGKTLFLVISLCSLSISGFSNSIVLWGCFVGLFVCKNLRQINRDR